MSISSQPAAILAAPSRPGLSLGRIRHRLREMLVRWRERQELWSLTDRELRDLGITRLEAETEARRVIF